MTPRSWSPAALALCLLSPSLALAQPAETDAPALTLERVLGSIEQTHPDVGQAQAKIASSRGSLLSSRGAFDLQARAGGEVYWPGKKAYGLLDTTLFQPTTLWGLELFGGWRTSVLNEVPDYKDQFKVKADKDTTGLKAAPQMPLPGQVHAGVAVPLLRDGPIDKRRAGIAKARAKLDGANASFDAKLLALQLKGAQAYWDWVAAGLELEIARELLAQAQQRNEQIAERVRRGELAPIELLENQRAILKREGGVVKAQRKIQKASIKLSLFLRQPPPEDDPDQPPAPVRPDEARLPDGWPGLTLPTEAQMIDRARQAARALPTWREIEAQREAALVERDLAQNQLTPELDLMLAAAQQINFAALPELMVTLNFATPLQRREARGELEQADAELVRLRAAQRQLTDQAEAEARDAYSALRAAQAQVDLAARELEVARKVEQAEKTKLELGASTLFIVNLREQKRAEAAQRLIDAQKTLMTAWATWRAATGRRPDLGP